MIDEALEHLVKGIVDNPEEVLITEKSSRGGTTLEVRVRQTRFVNLQLVVGRIGRAHGVLGEATIEVRTDNPDQRFAVGSKLKLDNGSELIVKSYRWHNQVLLLSFEGITDRNQIEDLKDQLLSAQVDTSDLPMVKAIIDSIDIENKKIVVDPPEGLLDVAL